MMTDKSIKNSTESAKAYLIPLADIYETDDLYSMKLEMPGVQKENLEIVIDDDELKITATSSIEENEKALRYTEISAKDFSRTFRIGNDIDRNRIDAKLENGVLALTLHKSEAVKPKKIAINQIN